jgi:hypothetical protein
MAQAERQFATRRSQRVADVPKENAPLHPTRSLFKKAAADCRRLFAHGVLCGFPLWRFISFEAPLVAGASALPVPKYAFAGPGGVLPLLTSLLAPPGLPLPPLICRFLRRLQRMPSLESR